MLKSRLAIGAAALAVAAPAAAAPIGPEAAACKRGARSPAVLVTVAGFRERRGTLRVQIYGSNPADFLARGRGLERIDLPVTRSGPMAVCVALPRTGRYAVAVRHDADANGRTSWADGGGFSRNPALSLTRLRPTYDEVAISVGKGVRAVNVRLLYREGIFVRPAGS